MVEEAETPEVSEPTPESSAAEPTQEAAPATQQPSPPPVKTFDAKPWSEVADKFTAAFPNLEPKEMEKKYNAVRSLAMERQRIADLPNYTGIQDAAIAGMPFAGYGLKVLQETEYKNAKERIFDGNPRDEFHPLVEPYKLPSDFETVARWEKANADRADRGTAGNVALAGVGTARFVGETVLGGVVGKAAGLGAKMAGWFGLGAATAGSSLEGAAERASGKQDESRFYSPENVIPEATIGAATALVMGGASRWAQGIANPVTRYLAEVGGGVGGIQGVKAAAGVMDEFLAPAWKTNTGYGVMGKIVRGENGPALQEAVTDTLTMAALALLHAGKQSKVHEQVIDDIKESLNESAKEQLPPNEAAARVRSKVNQSAAETLGVKPDATPHEIKTAWRKRIMETHPDRGGDIDEFNRVQWAYDQMTGELTRRSARNRKQQQEQPNRPKTPPESPGSQETPNPVYEPHPSMAPQAQEPPKTAPPAVSEPPVQPNAPETPPAAPKRPYQRPEVDPLSPRPGIDEMPAGRRSTYVRPDVDPLAPNPGYGETMGPEEGPRVPRGTPEQNQAEHPDVKKAADLIQSVFDKANLTDREKHVLIEKAGGRTHEEIGTDVEALGRALGGKAYTRSRVQQIEKSALEKIKEATGKDFESIYKSVNKPDVASAQQDLNSLANVNKETKVAVVGSGDKGGSIKDPENNFQDAWLKRFEDLKASEEYKKSPAVTQKAMESQLAEAYKVANGRRQEWLGKLKKLKKTPEWKEGRDDDRGRLLDAFARQFDAERGPVEQAPVRPESSGPVQPPASPGAAPQAPQNEGPQEQRGSANAGNREAAGNELTHPALKEIDSVNKELAAGLQKHLSTAEVEQADQLAREQVSSEAGVAPEALEGVLLRPRGQGSEPGGPSGERSSEQRSDQPIVPGTTESGPVQAGYGSPEQSASGGEPGGSGRSLADHVKEVATQFLHDDGAAINLDTLKEKMAQVASAAHYTGQAIRRLAGQMFPATTDLDRVSGEKMAEWAHAEYHAIEQGEWYGNEVVGFPEGSKEDVRLGAVITEMALGYTRAAYGKEAARLSGLAGAARQQAAQATNPSDKARFLHQAAEFSIQASDAMNAKLKVTSVIGMHGSPFTTLQEFQGAKADPVVQKQLKDWRDKLSYVLDDNYRESKGISAFAAIDAPTQMPGLTVNLMALQEGDKVSSTMGSQGNPKNLRMKKNPFANQRSGAAEAYELSAHKMIKNSFAKGTPNAARAVFVRTAVDRKIAELAPRGTKIEGMTEFIDAKPPAGTQDAGPRDTSFFIKNEAAGEYRTMIDIDKHNAFTKIMSVVSQVPTMGALSSAVEIMTHGANLGTALQAPGMLHTFSGAVGLAKNEWNQLFHNHEFQREVMELSKIGATKGRGAEAGTIVGAARKIGVALFGKEIPKSADKYDPTYWTGRALHHFDKLMRVSLAQAYRRITPKHLQTDTGLRDFINQWLGMYNRKGQNCVVSWLRASGFGPFATAATGQTIGSIRNLVGSPRMGSIGWGQHKLRLSFLARLVGTLVGGVFGYNYARWGRIDGDADTPFGNIKLDDQNGKHRSWDMMRFTGVTRGLRAIGGLAVIEGLRRGQSAGTIADHAVSDIGHTLAHPFTGPVTQFGYMAVTGKDTMGRQVADKVSTATTPKGMAKAAQTGKPAPGSSQAALNVKAALENMNQPYATLFGDRSRKNDTTTEETVSKLFQPLGIKYRDISKKKR